MPHEHHYIVLIFSAARGEDPYEDPEAFGPPEGGAFHKYDDARATADRLAADDPSIVATVLPVKPSE